MSRTEPPMVKLSREEAKQVYASYRVETNLRLSGRRPSGERHKARMAMMTRIADRHNPDPETYKDWSMGYKYGVGLVVRYFHDEDEMNEYMQYGN